MEESGKRWGKNHICPGCGSISPVKGSKAKKFRELADEEKREMLSRCGLQRINDEEQLQGKSFTKPSGKR